MIALGDPSADGPEAAGALLEEFPGLRVSLQQAPERRLVAGQRAEDLGAPDGQPQGDVAAVGVRDHVGGSEAERLQQRREVVAVLIDAAGRVRPLAARVAAAVIDDHAEGLSQAGNHESPAPGVPPRSMNQDQGRAALPWSS
jgi:hypothetical protein